jgi:hypothetical protein
MSDRPQPRVVREHPTVTFVGGALFGVVALFGVLVFVLPPYRAWPETKTLPPASPFVLPPEIIAYYQGERLRLTETAPTPTPSPTPTSIPATADPMKFCGISSEKDRLCRWPEPPAPTPTPYPDCATPVPDTLCTWRQP